MKPAYWIYLLYSLWECLSTRSLIMFLEERKESSFLVDAFIYFNLWDSNITGYLGHMKKF